MTKRRAILHIGTEKTGSTSIQFALSHLRDALPQHGFAYSLSAGSRNHLRLAAYAGDPERVRELRADVARMSDGGGPVERFPDDLAAEMAQLPENVHSVIFSGEHCHSRLTSTKNVKKLKDLLDVHFDEYKVVVYLRRQDELAVSLFSTRMRNGDAKDNMFPKKDDRLSYYDYKSLTDRWSTVFGKEAIYPRLYGRSYFPDGDIVKDFLLFCELPPMAAPEEAGSRNPSLLPAAQEFLCRFNQTKAGLIRPRPRWVFKFLNQHYAGAGRRPSRQDAIDFVKNFEEDNESIRARYFPDRDHLFSKDFSSYPEEEVRVSDAEILSLAISLVDHLSTRPKELQKGRKRGEIAESRSPAPRRARRSQAKIAADA